MGKWGLLLTSVIIWNMFFWIDSVLFEFYRSSILLPYILLNYCFELHLDSFIDS